MQCSTKSETINENKQKQKQKLFEGKRFIINYCTRVFSLTYKTIRGEGQKTNILKPVASTKAPFLKIAFEHSCPRRLPLSTHLHDLRLRPKLACTSFLTAYL